MKKRLIITPNPQRREISRTSRQQKRSEASDAGASEV